MPTLKMFEINFKTLEELDKVILDYFAECLKEKRPLTISGLANALGTNRQTLLNYEKKEGYEKENQERTLQTISFLIHYTRGEEFILSFLMI